MKKLLIIGSGRSSSTLIQYLEKHMPPLGWKITVADLKKECVEAKINPPTQALEFDVFDDLQRDTEIQRSNLVVSMLPARFHQLVALSCLKYSKSLLTASYVSPELEELDAEARSKGILFLNEIGVDPGIDHMSAMAILNRIKNEGYKLLCFESFTGGLVAPESDNNPWHYKFTWNPRNVVLAGQGGPARFIQEGKYKYIPYNRLFRRTEKIEIEGFGKFEGYANRDSLKYIEKYGLEEVPTVYRGTLRRPGFCRAWDVFVQLGATDDTYIMENTEEMSYKDFINSFLYYTKHNTVRLKLMHYLNIHQGSEIMEKLDWLGIFDETKIGLKNATPAQILLHILKDKWKLESNDKDMIVMWHKFIYEKDGNPVTLTSSMGITGDDKINTAMSKTVGLPLAIATKMVATGQISISGVRIPIVPEIYKPVLRELRQNGIEFIDNVI